MLITTECRRRIAGALMVALAEPWLVVPLLAQNEPNQQMYAVFEYREKAQKEFADKNIAVARENCRRGLELFNRLPQSVKSQNTGFKAQLDQLDSDVKKADAFVGRKTGDAKDLIGGRRLYRAKDTLEEVGDYAKDARVSELVGRLNTSNEEFDRVIAQAKRSEQTGNKKSAHNGYKQAQSLNKDANLTNEISRTNGCYGACKAAIWTVVLAGGAAGSYYGYQEYEKRKK